MLRSIILFTIFLSFHHISAYSQITFQKIYGDSGNFSARKIIETLDGGYLIAGTARKPGFTAINLLLIKTDSAGDTLWTKRYGGNGYSQVSDILQTPDSGYVVIGSSTDYGSGFHDMIVMRTAPDGSVIWHKIIGGQGLDLGGNIVATSDSAYVLTGFYTNNSNVNTIALIKLGGSGNLLWSSFFDGYGSNDVIQTPDDGFAILGSDNGDIRLIKTDENGSLMWQKSYGGVNDDRGKDIEQTSDGGFVIAGYHYTAGIHDAYIIKTNASGDTLWTRTYSSNDFRAFSIFQTVDDGYIIAGAVDTAFTNSYDAITLKIDSSGYPLWSKKYGNAGSEVAYTAIPTSDGGIAIAGSNLIPFAGEYAQFIKADSLGNSGCNESPFLITTNTYTTLMPAGGNIFSSSLTISSPQTAVTIDDLQVIDLCAVTGISPDANVNQTIHSVSPNPSNGQFNIMYLLPQNQKGKLEVIDVNGRKVFEMNLPQWSTMQEVSLPDKISSGIYNCVISSGDMRVNKKIAVIRE